MIYHGTTMVNTWHITISRCISQHPQPPRRWRAAVAASRTPASRPRARSVNAACRCAFRSHGGSHGGPVGVAGMGMGFGRSVFFLDIPNIFNLIFQSNMESMEYRNSPWWCQQIANLKPWTRIEIVDLASYIAWWFYIVTLVYQRDFFFGISTWNE